MIDKYIVWGRMQTGTMNTNADSSAFIALLTSLMKIASIKLYTLNNHPGEHNFAASWDTYGNNENLFGVIATDNHHYMFEADPITSDFVGPLKIYPNAIAGTTLLSLHRPYNNLDYFGYFAQTSGGDRQILVNWRIQETADSNTLLLSKPGYDVYHSKRQISLSIFMWGCYLYKNKIDPSKFFWIKNLSFFTLIKIIMLYKLYCLCIADFIIGIYLVSTTIEYASKLP